MTRNERQTGSKRRARSSGRGDRRQGREMALQMLYQHDQAGAPPAQLFREFDLYLYASETAVDPKERGSQKSFDYAQKLVSGVARDFEALDELIIAQAENWRIERMPAVDRNVLRLAFWELLNEADVPKVVIVDEAIELAKKFGSERSGSFVNGLLDGYMKQHPGLAGEARKSSRRSNGAQRASGEAPQDASQPAGAPGED